MSGDNPWGDAKFKFPWKSKKQSEQTKSSPIKKFQGFNAPIWLVAVIVAGVWVGTGFYIVRADEQAVVKRFGKVISVTNPGPHFHLPFPIETVDKAEVTKIHRTEIGFRPARDGSSMDVKGEAHMLTGDENIVSVKLIVQYQIKDIADYLYNVRNVPATIKNAAQSAIREVAGKEAIDEFLTTGKNRVQQETMVILQDMLDSYKAGVRIVAVQLLDVSPPGEVVAAFKDVASAREDKNRFINEAEAYANEIIPKARGEAETMIQQAEAYKTQKVEEALGDASRFEQILTAYKQSPDITQKRMYIETMEEVLGKANVRIFDSNIKNINTFIGADKIGGSAK